MDTISQSNDRLKDNYSWQSLNWQEFLSFTVVYDREADRLISFGGLQYGRWGERLARVSSRVYISPPYRGRMKPSIWYNKWMMPFQLKHAPEWLDACFWSRNNPNKRNFSFMVKQANDACPWGFKHEEQSGVYNVCRPIPNSGAINNSESCWQRVTLIRFTKDYELDLPHLSLDDYNAKFCAT
jgi:hypothetical protein